MADAVLVRDACLSSFYTAVQHRVYIIRSDDGEKIAGFADNTVSLVLERGGSLL